MDQAIVVALTRWVLRNPHVIRRSGAVVAVGAAVGLVFAVRAYRAYPSAPEPMSLAAALARADAGTGNRWVRVPATAVGCDRAARDDRYVYVPIADDPLVLAQFAGRVDCAAIDPAGIVGVIRRPPARWVRRVVGETAAPVYALATWDGPGDTIWAVYLALAGIVLGAVFVVIGPIAVRRAARDGDG